MGLMAPGYRSDPKMCITNKLKSTRFKVMVTTTHYENSCHGAISIKSKKIKCDFTAAVPSLVVEDILAQYLG